MGAKIVTLSVTDQNLLCVALDRAVEWAALMHDTSGITSADRALTERIKALKERLV